MAMTKTPEIRINFSHLLYSVSRDLDRLYSPDESKLASPEECEEWTRAYRAEWEKHESKLLTAITEILDTEFYREVIDVSLAPYFIPQSDPLIMHFRNDPDAFVDALTHELIHIILTDNNKIQINAHQNKVDLLAEWQKLFGKEHDFKTLIHIPVHAVHKGIYLDYLHDESRYSRDIERARELKNGEGYVRSWQYVNKHGYKGIVDQLKKSFRKLEDNK